MIFFNDIIFVVIGLEKNMEPQHRDKIYDLGKECAYEGISQDRFKAHNSAEKVIFLEGYKAGLESLKKNTLKEKENITVDETIKHTA